MAIMRKADSKGGPLEKAVYMIQETLLHNDPRLKGTQFTIELNKRLTVGGARHEVDVYVVTQPKTPYESIVLFECKDWAKPVSKNEVMNLNAKVDLFGASRGVLVAPTISKDAEALLQQYRRIQYRKCAEDFGGILTINAVHTVHEPLKVTAHVTKRNPNQQFPTNYLDSICSWGGSVSTFHVFADRWVDEIANHDKIDNQKRYNSESAHWHQTIRRIEFMFGEFTMNGIDIAAVELDVTFFVSVVVNSPRYMCAIEGDGRYVSFDIIHPDFPNRNVELSMVLVA